jgi:hypothetical protein
MNIPNCLSPCLVAFSVQIADPVSSDQFYARPPIRDAASGLLEAGHINDILAANYARTPDRLTPRPLRRGVRPKYREAPRELPPGVLPPRTNRGRGAHDRPRSCAFLTRMSTT